VRRRDLSAKIHESRKKYERDILSWMSRSLKTPPYPVGEKAGWRSAISMSLFGLPCTCRGLEYQDLNMDGVVWFRRRCDLPEQWDMHPLLLSLGAVDDMDTVWVNGFKVGGIGRKQRHRGIIRAATWFLRPRCIRGKMCWRCA
jgi:hypothetical protein